MQPLIDTHLHLWDLAEFDLPWTAGIDVLNRSFTLADYATASAAQAVSQMVYMEVNVKPDQRSKENEFILQACERSDNSVVGAVIAADMDDPNLADYLAPHAGNAHLKGVRSVLHTPQTPPRHCLNEAFIGGVRLLGAKGLNFSICIRPGELADAVSLAQACPDTRIVLDHCGNADPTIVNGRRDDGQPQPDNPFWHRRGDWLDAIERLSRLPNVVCKLSGIIARAPKDQQTAADLAPTVDACIDAFGTSRVIFGGDWPVCLLAAKFAEWATLLREIISRRKEQDQQAILSGNTRRVYQLA